MQIIEESLAFELNAAVAVDFKPTGLEYEAVIPLANLETLNAKLS